MGLSQENLLDWGHQLIQYPFQLFLPNEVHSTFFEVVIKWACLKIPQLCLPQALAWREAHKILCSQW
jgi:hypothetical protein